MSITLHGEVRNSRSVARMQFWHAGQRRAWLLNIHLTAKALAVAYNGCNADLHLTSMPLEAYSFFLHLPVIKSPPSPLAGSAITEHTPCHPCDP